MGNTAHGSSATYFISDVHLGLRSREEERAKEDRLLDFLRSVAGDAERLVIVGDLFDFWFEYRTVIPKGFHRTLAALHNLTGGGVPIDFLVGNHDCWLGDFFEAELGMTVHFKPFETLVQGKRVYVHHGDGLAENDLGYRMIKPVLRNRFNIWLYRWLHPDIGVRLARGSSRTSRQYTTNKHYGEGEGMARHAATLIDGGADIVVMGHRHVPELRPIGKGVYVNLGDWVTHNTFGVMRGGTITLETWNGQPEKRNADKG
jgi:UDP-2,3-diacylglucosamine hydrolase